MTFSALEYHGAYILLLSQHSLSKVNLSWRIDPLNEKTSYKNEADEQDFGEPRLVSCYLVWQV